MCFLFSRRFSRFNVSHKRRLAESAGPDPERITATSLSRGVPRLATSLSIMCVPLAFSLLNRFTHNLPLEAPLIYIPSLAFVGEYNIDPL